MRINTNISALTAHQNLARTQAAAQESMTRLSSGFRINRAGDDAAGLSIANSLRTNVRSLTMASRNIEQAQSLFQIAEGAASSIQKIVERMKELAVQAATDTNESQRETLSNEWNQLVEEIDRIVGATQFQGTTLLNGDFSGKTLQIGAGNTGDEQLTVSIDQLDTATLGLAEDALTTGAGAAMDAADQAIDTVNAVLSAIGAYQNRLDFAQTNVKTAILNVSAAESVIRDVDMAAEMTNFSKQQILAQAGTAMLAQANQSAQSVLQLLRG
jgi:flagellin